MDRLIKVLFVITISSIFVSAQTPIFINEIHYDNTGADTGEGVEIAGPAGTDLSGWSLELYNGANGAVYETESLSGTIPDLCNGGVIYFPIAGIQNGAPDGIALINSSSTVIQFLSYEGSFVATGGTANGMTSTDIGVSETTSTPVGHSLQLEGIGPNYEDYTWGGPKASTPGACNSDQSLPVELSIFNVKESSEGVLIKWRTESEFENIGFFIERNTENTAWSEIISYKDDDTLLGQGTASYPSNYEYIDRFVEKGKKYYYRLADVDQNGVVTYHQSESIIVDSNPLSAIPDRLSLTTYPNPFNPTINILYSVNENNLNVKIDIFNIKGELVNSLLDKNQSQGWHSIQWGGLNSNGNAVPGGTYICQIKAGNEVRNTKIVYLK